MKKVSVVIPVYNTEKWIEKCILSVQNGGCDNIEIIVVNDGSSDNSSDIINRLMSEDSRIIHIQKKNEGAAIARETGIDISMGEYVLFVDSDDYIEPHSIAEMVLVAERDAADMVFTDYNITFNDMQENVLMSMNPKHFDLTDGLSYLRGEVECYMCMKLYKTEFVRDVKQQVSPVCEDTFAMVQILPRCKKVSHVRKPLYNYLQTPDSIMRFSRQRTVGEWLKHALQMIELIPTLNLPKDIEDIFYFRNIHTIHRYRCEGDMSSKEYSKLERELAQKLSSTLKLRGINSFHRLKLATYILLIRIFQ